MKKWGCHIAWYINSMRILSIIRAWKNEKEHFHNVIWVNVMYITVVLHRYWQEVIKTTLLLLVWKPPTRYCSDEGNSRLCGIGGAVLSVNLNKTALTSTGGLTFIYLFSPGPVVIQKMMSPCSIWQGLWAAAQERRFLCINKRGNYSPLSKCRGFSVYSMNKTGGRRKMFITRANSASWLSSCWAPSQSLLKLLLWAEIAL
jgi:hypothetical protein